MLFRGCREAIKKYTEAISAAKGDTEAVVPALLNRSIAQYKLGNYGHSLNDAKACLEVNPSDVKALYRYVLSKAFYVLSLHYKQVEANNIIIILSLTYPRLQGYNMFSASFEN